MSDDVFRRPLGPNEGTAPGVAPYEYKAWPAWRYNPETGAGQVFEAEEEVPHGWTNVPPGTTEPDDEPVTIDVSKIGTPVVEPPTVEAPAPEDDDGDTADAIPEVVKMTRDELVALGQARLAAILEEKNGEEGVEIEFLPNWPKAKLADTVIENGGYPAPVQED